MDKPDLPVEQDTAKAKTTTKNLDETASTASKKVRLTRARKQLADLVDKKRLGLRSLATKTEIRRAILKVESEYNIICKLIYNLKETIALEDGDEHTDIGGTRGANSYC